jgi:hypothetical protein
MDADGAEEMQSINVQPNERRLRGRQQEIEE